MKRQGIVTKLKLLDSGIVELEFEFFDANGSLNPESGGRMICPWM